jgi:hypothetical protein
MTGNQGDVVEVGNVTGSGIAIGAGAVANVVNVHFDGVLPTLNLHALREQLVARSAPPDALATIDRALADLPRAEAVYRHLLHQAYGRRRDAFVDLDLHADEARHGRGQLAPWMQPEFCAMEHIGRGQVKRVRLNSLTTALGRYPAIALLVLQP